MSKDLVTQTEERVIELEPIMEPGDSPLQSGKIIERIGGDDFITQQRNSHQQPIVEIKDISESDMPPGYKHNPTFTPPPPMGSHVHEVGGPAEFQVQNPEEEFIQSQQQQQVMMETELTEESTNMMADMILTGAEMALPLAFNSYHRINEEQVKKFEQEGKIGPGSYDAVRDINRRNEDKVKLDKKKKEFIRKPLEQVLAVKGVKADPTTLLIIAVVFVLLMMGIESYRIKKENDETVKMLIDSWNKKQIMNTITEPATVVVTKTEQNT